MKLRVQRYNPEVDTEPHWQDYDVEAEPTDRVLDLLHHVKWYVDGTLTFRRSCGHGVCGSDAMLINGRNRLACESLVGGLGDSTEVAPLPAFGVIKDLLVDMEPFWEQYRSVRPYLVNDEEPGDGRERRQSPAERAAYDDTTKCILCAACTSSCPSYWPDRRYVGPAAIVNAHRFIFDSRDRAHEERLGIMTDPDGVWRCRTIFNCVEACPRGIDVTGAILSVTREIGTG